MSYSQFVEIKEFSNIPRLRCAFSMKKGGVSPHPYDMNLSNTVGDDPQNVIRNYRLMAEALQIPAEHMVYAHQTHTTNVLSVSSEHWGMGVLKERSFQDIDALVTHEPNVCLVTGHADCVPIFLVEPENHVIGLAHAGWRGTVGNIAANTVKEMCDRHGADVERIIAHIGPSICRSCYEIGEDVADAARNSFPGERHRDILFPLTDRPGKSLFDLRAANRLNLIAAGVPEESISISGYCTCCDSGIFHSHRASGGKRGGNSAFLMLLD